MSWIKSVEREIDISIVSIITRKKYKSNKKKLKKIKDSKLINIIVVPNYTQFISTIVYFTLLIFKNKQVIVHLKKVNPKAFDLLKFIFKQKLKYLIDIEGDFESELEYLSKKEKKYKKNFYNTTIQGMKKASKALKKQILNADAVIVGTKEMKNLMVKRYPNIDIFSKVHAMTTGYDIEKFYYCSNLRNETRKKYNLNDKFVMIYSGNVFYSWQNLSRSIKVFKLLRKKISNFFFIMLIREEDHYIAKGFIKKHKLSNNEYYLNNVNHKQVNRFLNASDIGIILRENHTLNKVASPGKLSEYLGSGLKIISTKHIGSISNKIKNTDFAILLNDIYDDSELIEKIPSIHSTVNRKEISSWAQKHLSTDAYKETYLTILKNL